LQLFHDAVRKAEAQEVTAVQSCMIHSHLKGKLNTRKEENVIPLSVRELLSSLEELFTELIKLNVNWKIYSPLTSAK
jgi:hypothetical protein